MATRAELQAFPDRRAAGRALGAALLERDLADPVIVGLPRGGVPVAYEVARALQAPLDVLAVRKIGAPSNPELAIGAVAEDGVQFLDDDLIARLLVSHEELEHAIALASAELARRIGRYRRTAARMSLAGRTVIVVDDGLATGATARAAVRSARERGAALVTVAVPVGSRRAVQELAAEADEIVCLLTPEPMWAVGSSYREFGQTSDDEVSQLLERAQAAKTVAITIDPDPPVYGRARIWVDGLDEPLHGDLAVPANATGLVIFAHGSGSSRHSPRNRQVARALNRRGFGTFLLDLLTSDEERVRRNVFDAPLLGRRLLAATAWAVRRPELAHLPVAYFGASTGAGAALWAAAESGDRVRAVVSRGGRPDLAGPRLGEVLAPVLLIVGSADGVVSELNRRALKRLRCPAELSIVRGATHLFEEPGALDEVARLAGDWLSIQFGRTAVPSVSGANVAPLEERAAGRGE